MLKFLTKLLTYLKYAAHFVRNFNINLAFNTRLKSILYLAFAFKSRNTASIPAIFLNQNVYTSCNLGVITSHIEVR